jgi:hypothetical protein
MGGNPAKQRRAQQDAANHFTNDAGLPEFAGQPATDQGDGKNDGHLHQK